MKFVALIASFIFSIANVQAQSYSLQLKISNQPAIPVILGQVKGDKFIPVDSSMVQPVTSGSPDESTNRLQHKIITFEFSDDSPTGMYRLILGKTRVAEIMNEPPQQLDFIFNHENLVFETDFKMPEDSLKIIQSEENIVWFEFKRQEKEYKAQIRELEMEVNYYQTSAKQAEAAKRIEEYNRLQKERDELITKTIIQYPNLFATKLIKMYLEPFLDGNLSEHQRKEVFKNEFFNQLDFTDEALINTSVYTDKVFQYLMAYAQKGLTRKQQEQEFVKATEIILQNASKKPVVYEFVLDYLVRGFEKMNLNNVLESIADKYEGTTCQTDEKNHPRKTTGFSEIYDSWSYCSRFYYE